MPYNFVADGVFTQRTFVAAWTKPAFRLGAAWGKEKGTGKGAKNQSRSNLSELSSNFSEAKPEHQF